MNALDVRAQVVAGIQAVVGDRVQVESHRGRFDSPAELKRYSMRAPAVLVALLWAQRDYTAPGLWDLRFNVFVVTRDAPGVPRDVSALALVTQIGVTLDAADWGVADCFAPSDVRADNLYSGQIDTLGVGMWGMRWDQRFTLDALDPADLEPFLTFHEDTDLAPADGTIDMSETDELPQ